MTMGFNRNNALHNTRVLRKAARALSNFGDDLDDEALKGIHETAKRILKTAKSFAPVDTGALKRSGRVRKLKSSSKITFGGASSPRYVNYAAFVEEGTFSRPPSHFLKKALAKHKGDLQKNVKRTVSKRWLLCAQVGSSRAL